MKIKLKCECGKVLGAPAESAGKLAKCPGCGRTLRVPIQGIAGAPPQPPVVCPECSAENPHGAVVCGNCGLNLETGKHLILGTEEPTKKRPRRGIARTLLPVAALILVIAAVALFVVLRSAPELEAWELIPQNASIVGKMDARKMKEMPALSEALGQLGGGTGIAELKLEQRLKDAHCVYVALVPGRTPDAGVESLMLYETLSPIKKKELIGQLQSNQTVGAPVKIEGKNAYPLRTPEPAHGKAPEQMLIVLQKHITAVGTRNMIQTSIRLAARKSTASVKSNQKVMTLCGRANPNKAVWIVGTDIGQLLALAAPPGFGVAGGIEGLGDFMVECDWGETIGFSAAALLECASVQAAANTAGQLQAVTPMLAPFGLDEETIKVTSEASAVNITVALSPEKLKQLTETMGPKMPSMMPGMPGMEEMKGMDEGGEETELIEMEEGEESQAFKEFMEKAREAEGKRTEVQSE